MKRRALRTGVLATAVLLFVAPAHAQPCVGDCNDSGEVTVDELVASVNIAVGNAPAGHCPASDCHASGVVTVDCLVRAVTFALNGCVVGLCGNGAREYVEGCDDGNTDPLDGCTDGCTICGNRTVTPPEECDVGNRVDGDGCDRNCRLTACGNGVATAGEQWARRRIPLWGAATRAPGPLPAAMWGRIKTGVQCVYLPNPERLLTWAT